MTSHHGATHCSTKISMRIMFLEGCQCAYYGHVEHSYKARFSAMLRTCKVVGIYITCLFEKEPEGFSWFISLVQFLLNRYHNHEYNNPVVLYSTRYSYCRIGFGFSGRSYISTPRAELAQCNDAAILHIRHDSHGRVCWLIHLHAFLEPTITHTQSSSKHLTVLRRTTTTTALLIRRASIAPHTGAVRLADVLVARARIQRVIFTASLALSRRLGLLRARLVWVESRV
jgi:hypothetical protein